MSLPALYLDRFFNADQKLSRTGEVKLFHFRRDLNMMSNAAALPLAYTENKVIIIEDKAIFKDGKLVGELVGKEAGMYHLLYEDTVENMNYTITLEEDGKEVSVSTRINATLNYKFNKTNPANIQLDISGKSEIVHLSEHDYTKVNDHIEKISKKLEDEITKDIQMPTDKMKEINVEAWLIGHRILWARDTNYYDSLKWKDTGWKNSVYDITISMELEQTGQRSILDTKKIGR